MASYEKPIAKSPRVAKEGSPRAKGLKSPVYDPAAKVAEMDAETEKLLVDAAKIMAPTKGDVELAREVEKAQKDPLQKKAEENNEAINSSPYFDPGETTASHTERAAEPSSEPAAGAAHETGEPPKDPLQKKAEENNEAINSSPYFDPGETTASHTERAAEPSNEPIAAPTPETAPAAPSASEAEKEAERKNREEFERIKNEFDENEKKIFEGREGVGRKWRIISSALESVGLTKRKAKDEEIKEFLEKREDLRRKLKIAGYKA
ncbi:MAG: hypothetical protein PHP25_03000, partial [Candidatus Moranbacteria bacterium]|nr:hypothetical protein [Candidatus Moranbacteria bacterium]